MGQHRYTLPKTNEGCAMGSMRAKGVAPDRLVNPEILVLRYKF
jgi:hypothetical protein